MDGRADGGRTEVKRSDRISSWRTPKDQTVQMARGDLERVESGSCCGGKTRVEDTWATRILAVVLTGRLALQYTLFEVLPSPET